MFVSLYVCRAKSLGLVKKLCQFFFTNKKYHLITMWRKLPSKSSTTNIYLELWDEIFLTSAFNLILRNWQCSCYVHDRWTTGQLCSRCRKDAVYYYQNVLVHLNYIFGPYGILAKSRIAPLNRTSASLARATKILLQF